MASAPVKFNSHLQKLGASCLCIAVVDVSTAMFGCELICIHIYNIHIYNHVSSPPTTPFGLPGEAVHFFFPVRCGWVGSLILPGATIQHVTQIPIFILHHFICWLMFPLRQLHLLDCRVKQSISSSPLQITRAASTSIFLQAVSDPTLLCW